MNQPCPFCGSNVDDSSEEIRPGVRRCPTCGQEVDEALRPQAPEQPADQAGQQDWAGGQGDGQTPPPPPGAGAEPNAQAQAGPTEHTPAWELDGGVWLEKMWRTIWQVLLHPGLTFAAPGRMKQQYPLGFGLILGTFGSVLNAFWEQMIPLGEPLTSPFLAIFLSPFIVIIGIYIGTAIMHLSLMIVGAAKGGFNATFRVAGYSYSGYIFMVIPILGIFVAIIWMLVVQVGGLAAAHGTTYGRAIGAMLLCFAAILVILLLLYMLMILLVVFTGNWAP